MIKAICYISNINQTLTSDNINDLVTSVIRKNNQYNITGLLLIQNGHFFQIIEGHPDKIDLLYSNITEDQRHNGIIKLLDKTIDGRIFDEYNSGKFSIMTDYKGLKKLYLYFNWITNANYLPADEIMSLTKNFLKNNK